MPRPLSLLPLGLITLLSSGCCLLNGTPCYTDPPPNASLCDPSALTAGVGGGVDANTDAAMAQVAIGCRGLEAGVGVGQASEDGYQIPERSAQSSGGGLSAEYTVIQTYLHGRYPFAVGGQVRAYPLVGARYLRYDQQDCTAGQGVECVFNEVTVDVGLGVGYKMFSLDAYTGLLGDVPDASIRASVMFPLAFGRGR